MISIVMSTYNEKIEWLKQAIDSILAQKGDYDIEFIIILDNPDNIEIESIVNDYKNKDNRIKIIKNERNLGLVRSLNKGIELASGKYIMRMDADDISEPFRIEEELKYLVNHQLDLVAGNIIKIDEQDNELGRERVGIISEKQIKKSLKIRNIIAHPTWFGKSEIFKKNNGYREIDTCEDYDFLLRCIDNGYNIGVTPEYVLKYRVRDNSICNTKQYMQFRNTQIIRKAYNTGNIRNIEKIITDINMPMDAKEEKKHMEVNQYIKKLNTLSKNKKILQTPKLMFMFFNNSICRRVIIDRIKLSMIMRKR